MIASIALAASMSIENIARLGGDQAVTVHALALASLGLVCSLVGIYAVKAFSNKTADVALRFGTIGSAAIFIAATYFLIATMGGGIGLDRGFGWCDGWHHRRSSHRYTGGAPVRKIERRNWPCNCYDFWLGYRMQP